MALVAGGAIPDAMRLGASMVLLQFAIGAVNDLVDAPADAGRKPGKPIPAGLVSRRTAGVVGVLSAAGGIGLAAPAGAMLVVLALVVLGIGLAYDLRLKGTAWSWLPFALGIPLLPVYGWLGATGTLPPAFAVLLPAAFVEGAALAVANALVDVERDRAAGRTSIAASLGRRRAARAVLALQVLVAGLAIGTSVAAAVTPGWLGLVAAVAAVLVGAAAAAARSSSPAPAPLEWAWDVQAVAAAVLGASWLAALAERGLL